MQVSPNLPASTADRLSWQGVLFAPQLNSYALMKLGAKVPDDAPILRVHRNHAFETIASALAPFFAFAETPLRVEIGDYDDSLSFAGLEPAAVHLLWLDFDRYAALADLELEAWLIQRLSILRAASAAPIAIANAPTSSTRADHINRILDHWVQNTPATAVLDLRTLARTATTPVLDEARAPVTGTRYSAQFGLQAGRALAFQVLPQFLGRPIKAIAIDLDNTLYAGVLGEDGVDGVLLTPTHEALQRTLAGWADHGILLAVVSRNQPEDVEALFAQRADFPLQPEQIADWQVNWGAKSSSIEAAAARFNIAPDSILLIDDNLGELLEAAHSTPGLRTLHAGPDTAAALNIYPGLSRTSVAFAGRAADVEANTARMAMAAGAHSQDDYLRELGATLSLSLNPAEDRPRLTELSVKTNQFNLALRRFNDLEVAAYLSAKDRGVVHIRLADRLSDSGSVGAVYAHAEDDIAVVDEICISCRALGRGLEDLMITEAVRRLGEVLACERVAFTYAEGPRNAPARRWLEAFTKRGLTGSTGVVRLDHALESRPDVPVAICWTT